MVHLRNVVLNREARIRQNEHARYSLVYMRTLEHVKDKRGESGITRPPANTFLKDLIILLPQVSWFHQTKHGHDLNTNIPRMTEFPFVCTDLDLTLSQSYNQ